ncbi:MAG: DUF2304 domain-containing protein [Candidatus Moraniibacteriota bacterium]
MSLVFIFRIVMVLGAAIFLLNAWLKFLKGERSQTFFKLIASNLIWLGIGFFSLFPNATHSVSQYLGFGESLNTFIFIGFVLVFAILFKIVNILERTERNISEIVRKEALSQIIK